MVEGDRPRYLEEWRGFESIWRLREYFARKAGGDEYVSEKSMEGYVVAVKEFVEHSGYKGPDEMLEEVRDGEMLKLLDGYIGWCNNRGNAPATQIRKHAMVKRWLRCNDRELDWKKVVLPKKRTVVRDKAPSRAELRKILMYAPTWLNAAVMVLATSGIRSGALAGLKLRHLDLETHPDIGVIEVPPELNKSRVGYYTFITPEAREALVKHLEKRRRDEESLDPEMPLIRPPIADGLSYQNLRACYIRTLERAGLDNKSRSTHILHLHTLRKWFRTQLESVMTSSYIDRLLGHVNNEYLDGAYFRPPEQDMVEAYRRAVPNLTILEDVQSEEFQRRQLLRQAALLLPEEKLQRLREILGRRRSLDVAVEEFRKLREQPDSGNHQVVDSEDEMLRMLNEGWELVRELNGDRFLMRLL